MKQIKNSGEESTQKKDQNAMITKDTHWGTSRDGRDMTAACR